MATTNIRTIGSGGTYADINAWRVAVLAIHTNFVTADVVEEGSVISNLSLSSAQVISGATTDATRYWRLTGNITNVYMKAGNLRKLGYGGNRCDGIDNQDAYTEICWLEITNWQANIGIRSRGSYNAVNIHHNIVHETATSAGTYWDYPKGIALERWTNDMKCKNNLIYNISNKHTAGSGYRYHGYGIDSWGSTEIYNNTVFNCSEYCIYDNFTDIKLKNNIGMNDTAWTYYSNASGTAVCFLGVSTAGGYNMDSDSSLPVGYSNQRGKNFTTQFIDYTTKDFNLKSGSDAIGNGIGPGSDASVPTSDFDGQTRSGATCDIGADILLLDTGRIIFRGLGRGINTGIC